MMATPQEEFDLMFRALLNSEGGHVKHVVTVTTAAIKLILQHKIVISDEQLIAMPNLWRTMAVSLLFDKFRDYSLEKLEKAKSSAEMN
jgi:hypothetical protein